MAMPKTIESLGEFGLINLLKKYSFHHQNIIRGIGDDTAVLFLNAQRNLLYTTDMMAEGVHFTRKTPPHAIGHKAMGCNISDIAAMGGVPTFALVSLGLPKNLSVQFVEELYKGMHELGRDFNVSIVGGDTVASKEIIINVALLGEVSAQDLVTRQGAAAGDWIFVTGALGRAWKGDKHLSFTPRVHEARFLVQHFKPSAMIDISDGLAADLGHILDESEVGACLHEAEIPLNRGAKLKDALYDGEDFELLFTLDPLKAKNLLDWQSQNQCWFFYPIGRIEKSRGLFLTSRRGTKKRLTPKGFTHF
jgi:thiamine-monophosphate kinase